MGSRVLGQVVAEAKARGIGAIVLAGPGGTGKSTAFQAAAVSTGICWVGGVVVVLVVGVLVVGVCSGGGM